MSKKNLPLVIRPDFTEFIIIGGGITATRNALRLLSSKAKLKVVCKQASDTLKTLAAQGKLELDVAEITASYKLPAQSWVVAATDDAQLNEALAKAAKAQGNPCYRVDKSTDNDFIIPVVVDRYPIQIAISSQGSAPGLSQYLQQRLEAFIPKTYEQLAAYVTTLRLNIEHQFDAKGRQVFWRRWFSSQAPELVLTKQNSRADALTQQLITHPKPIDGEVFLVGAGPGEPDLLTFRALRLIQLADKVFYDRLVGEEILKLASPEAELIYVGKAKSNHAVAQEEINQRLADEAKAGHKVLRLKGGDPFIFGRGGEEITTLAEQGVPFQVVPGITAASGCAAYAGIPLTHRDYAQSVRFVTGHLKDGTCDLPWAELIHPQQTLVIYMGITGLVHICEQLIKHGMNAKTPIALIEKGTLPEQKSHISNLADMPSYMQNHTISPPTLIIIGEVVQLHETLKWKA